MSLTFFLTIIAWIFFRADSVTIAVQYIKRIFSEGIISFPEVGDRYSVVVIIGFIAFEWLQRDKRYALEKIGRNWNIFFRWLVYYVLILIIVFFGKLSEKAEFIYFQF
jgi:hypothetical protein